MSAPDKLVKPTRAAGRKVFVELIDALLDKEDNITKLQEHMQDQFTANPLLFCDMHVKPLIPKSMIETATIETNEETAARIRMFIQDDGVHVDYEAVVGGGGTALLEPPKEVNSEAAETD